MHLSYIFLLLIGSTIYSCKKLRTTCSQFVFVRGSSHLYCRQLNLNKINNQDSDFYTISKKSHHIKSTSFIYKDETCNCKKSDVQCRTDCYFFDPPNSGFLPKNIYSDTDSELNELKSLEEKMNELNELHCGEVNEKVDLENWEKEYNNIKKKIANLQKKIIQNKYKKFIY